MFNYSLQSKTDSAELVEVLSNRTFSPIDPSPRTFASIRDGSGGLSSQSSPRLTSPSRPRSFSSHDDTPSVSSVGGSAALSPAVFNRLTLVSPFFAASSPTFPPPATWVPSGVLGAPLDSCGDAVETSAGRDLLSPFECATAHKHNTTPAMPRSSSEESFDGNTSGHTQFSQAVTASYPATPEVYDSSRRLSFGCALVRSNS